MENPMLLDVFGVGLVLNLKKETTMNKRIALAKQQLEETLNRVGYVNRKKTAQPLKRNIVHRPPTSDCIPGNGVKKTAQRYTGTEIVGVTLLHKQAYEPVRRDNPQAAKEAARMRRS